MSRQADVVVFVMGYRWRPSEGFRSPWGDVPLVHPGEMIMICCMGVLTPPVSAAEGCW